MTNSHDLLILGAGPGGYVAALEAARRGASVAVVESSHLGGTCLNNGCIPSKALLASAQRVHDIRHADELGVSVSGKVSFDWAKIQSRKDGILRTLRGGIAGLFKARKVELVRGRGRLVGGNKVAVDLADGGSSEMSARRIILAVGSLPAQIPGWPTDPAKVCTTDEALHWKELPRRLLIVGGGIIGCEFACMLQPLGVEATVVEMMPSLMPELDRHLGAGMEEILAARGVTIHTDTKVEQLDAGGDEIVAKLTGGEEVRCDRVLTAVGRRADTADVGLEDAGVETDRGLVVVNDRLETSAEEIYCIGDANGRWPLAHAASAQGVVAVANALGEDRTADAPVPGAVYTFPEVATVGLSEQQARQRKIPVAVGSFPLKHLGKAMAAADTEGFAKVLRHRETGRLLGVHMLGHNVTEIIAAATCMMHRQVTVSELAEVIFAHPTISESLKESAEDALGAALHLPPRKVLRVPAGG